MRLPGHEAAGGRSGWRALRRAIATRTALSWRTSVRSSSAGSAAGCGDDPDLADVYQDTLVHLHRARHTYEPARPFEPWLFALARHSAADHGRLRKRRMREVLVEDVPEVPIDGDQERPALADALSALPRQQREAFTMLKLEGLSVGAAAARAGTTPGALKVRAHRAYKALKEFLRGGNEGRGAPTASARSSTSWSQMPGPSGVCGRRRRGWRCGSRSRPRGWRRWRRACRVTIFRCGSRARRSCSSRPAAAGWRPARARGIPCGGARSCAPLCDSGRRMDRARTRPRMDAARASAYRLDARCIHGDRPAVSVACPRLGSAAVAHAGRGVAAWRCRWIAAGPASWRASPRGRSCIRRCGCAARPTSCST